MTEYIIYTFAVVGFFYVVNTVYKLIVSALP